MYKTPHCVCSPNSSVVDSSLKHIYNDMPSPPLPPRTLRGNLSTNKKQWGQLIENINCDKDKIQCSCNRPHSCPTEECSPPIPPKCNAQSFRYQSNKKFDEILSDDKKLKGEIKGSSAHRVSRKSGVNSSSTRKKSRSKSRPLVKDENLQNIRRHEQENFFIKTHDNLIDKNCEIFYKANKDFSESTVSTKLCQISENNESSVKPFHKPDNIVSSIAPQPHQPDLIPSRSNSNKVTESSIFNATDNSQKSVSKSRMKKFFGFLTKSKKVNDNNNRITTVTPEAKKTVKTTEVIIRPRRSKSLHLISSLSPTTSMHAKSNVISPEIKTKNNSIFAALSPTTARLKRNLLCISPKSTNNHKKQAATLSIVNNSKSVLSENSQQRPGLTSLTGARHSPVHLMAGGQNIEQCCTDKDVNPNIKNCNAAHFHFGDMCRGHTPRMDSQEMGLFNETSSGFKAHNHQDTSQRKPPQSSNQINRKVVVNNPSNCYNYPSKDSNCSSNNAYHHFCPSQPIVPSCGCMHNIVQINPNHFHCCHNNQQVWCIVPCCADQIPIKQYSFCSCQIYHQSASPPPNFSRQLPLSLPPAPPPPPVPSFSNNHQFSRQYRQSYSKTPPPSFHTHQFSCHDDHCYEEYNLNNPLPDFRQKMSLSHQFKSNTFYSNCCSGLQNQPCSVSHQSKCSGCGNIIYNDTGNGTTHYNPHKSQCSNTSMVDSVFDQKISHSRICTSSINADDAFNCRCLYNYSAHRHSETCGRNSNEMRIPNCRNSTHRNVTQTCGATEKERSSSKRRKNSSRSCHDSNVDPEAEDKHDISRTHHNSPSTNMLPSSSIHKSPEINNISCDMTTSTNNNQNLSLNVTNVMPSSSNSIHNDKKQQNFEPWRKTFHDNMMALRNLGWYWGPLNHLEAENLVQARADGTFLVRDSGNEAYFLSLTFRVLGTTYHTRIEYSQGKFSFWSQPESHSATTIVEFIDKAVAHSVSGKFHYFLQTNTPGQPPMEVSLLYPLSRYQIVQSLQHLSRFIILSNIRRDHVSQLDLPQSIKSYLMEKQYYIDSIETFVKITKDSEPLTYEPSGSVI